MTDFTLYYWPLPFRGEFVRSVLAHADASWEEAPMSDVNAMRMTAPDDQPTPHMGPPVLVDHTDNVALAQTGAILTYLGRKYSLLPEDAVREALTIKLIADANDVLYEMTRYHGAQMWTPDSWRDYGPRLSRWMQIFESMGRHHGLRQRSGTMLGTADPGIADLATYSLWFVMTESFPTLRPLLEIEAPLVAGLCERIAAFPEQRALRSRTTTRYGDAWCGGEIEASLRAALSGD